ncbi:MAG: site-specific recombinase [Acidimicrobiaceae bacterium]|jgi:site-specific DNA recombinase
MTPRRRDARGRRGFGHTQDRRQIVAGEAALIVEAARRVLDGTTLSAIVADWNRRAVTTTTGGPWRINALSALLIQPRLAGLDGPGPGADEAPPAILDATTHEALLALRHARRKKTDGRPANGSGRRYLLTGLLTCWRCGSRLGGIAPRATNVQPHYRCPSKGAGGCSGVVIHAAHADDAARDAVIERLDSPDYIASVESRRAVLAAQEQTMTELVADAVTGRSLDAGVPGLWTGGPRIDGQAWGQLKEALEARVGSGASELAHQSVVGRQQALCGAGAALKSRWEGMDLTERRSVIEVVVDHFVVQPAPRLRSQFTAERLEPVWRS